MQDDSAAFYQEQGKTLKPQILMGKKHVDLEREEWNDKRWLGDRTDHVA